MRKCNGCTFCCTVLKIEALDKPMYTACRHNSGSRCTIYNYDERPDDCATFYCGWAQGAIPKRFRPDKARGMMVARGTKGKAPAIQIWLDPKKPMRDDFHDWVEDLAKRADVILVTPDDRRLYYERKIGPLQGKLIELQQIDTDEPGQEQLINPNPGYHEINEAFKPR